MRFLRYLLPSVASLTLMALIGCGGEEPSPPPPPPDPDAAAAAAAGTKEAAKPTKAPRGSSTVNEKQGSGSTPDPAMGPG